MLCSLSLPGNPSREIDVETLRLPTCEIIYPARGLMTDIQTERGFRLPKGATPHCSPASLSNMIAPLCWANDKQ